MFTPIGEEFLWYKRAVIVKIVDVLSFNKDLKGRLSVLNKLTENDGLDTAG